MITIIGVKYVALDEKKFEITIKNRRIMEIIVINIEYFGVTFSFPKVTQFMNKSIIIKKFIPIGK
jgi:hypothetical protein